MIQGIFSFIKYPSASAIIGVVWIGLAILIINDRELPILKMVIINMLASFYIAYIGFRVDKM